MAVPPSNARRTFAPEPLTGDEVTALVAAASNQPTTGIRLRAIIGVLYGSGLRISEVLALYPRDADTQAGSVRGA